jgi:hypothetical protein
MSQIEKRGIESDAIDGTKTRFSNNESFRVRDFANAADISLFKVTASDVWEFQVLPKFGGSNIATESYVTTELANYIPSSEKGANNGVAELDANGKIPNSQVPSIAITDTYVVATQSAMLALSSAETGDVAVRTDLNKTFILAGASYSTLGDWQELLTPTDSVISVNGQTGVVSLDSDDVSEGSTNLYFTNTRAKTAAVVDSTAGNETDQAASVAAMKTFVNAQSANVDVETFVLSGTDVTNGYIDLLVTADKVLDVTPKGFPSQYPIDDYTLSVVSLKTRITFAGDMLSLIIGDKIKVAYSI